MGSHCIYMIGHGLLSGRDTAKGCQNGQIPLGRWVAWENVSVNAIAANKGMARLGTLEDEGQSSNVFFYV